MRRGGEGYTVRLARPEDAGSLGAVEQAAAARFAAIGMARIAEGRPTDESEYLEAIGDSRLWVVEASGGVLAGLAIGNILDGQGFLAEVSVLPDHAGHRLAALMIAALEAWALARGCRSVSLTTFRDVPWNRPYYESLGFVPLDEADAGPELRAVRAKEKARGVDSNGPRLCMVRRIGEGG
ncbi:GNAT family N-acetyltransferase [Pelagibius sp. CAU 1746]|uniref:GNAT family N-acetyltransferase n=1 Tax=Pelagibius sp. CAU 1746 TaxID=3140370 RepID=UPI00325C2D34